MTYESNGCEECDSFRELNDDPEYLCIECFMDKSCLENLPS